MDLRTGHGCSVGIYPEGSFISSLTCNISLALGQVHPPIGMRAFFRRVPVLITLWQTGHRQDAAHRYIHSQPQIRHLHVLTKTLVTRVLFDGTKAIGVEVIGNKNQDPDADQTPRRIIAHKLVVVSAGTFGSAMILQRSGIGEAAWLSHLGVDTVVDLPGVGLNYQDHAGCLVPYHVADDTETIDIIAERRPEVMKPYLDQFANGKGFLTSNVNDAGSKLRPTPEELKEMGPEFNEVWKRMYESAPDKVSFSV